MVLGYGPSPFLRSNVCGVLDTIRCTSPTRPGALWVSNRLLTAPIWASPRLRSSIFPTTPTTVSCYNFNQDKHEEARFLLTYQSYTRSSRGLLLNDIKVLRGGLAARESYM